MIYIIYLEKKYIEIYIRKLFEFIFKKNIKKIKNIIKLKKHNIIYYGIEKKNIIKYINKIIFKKNKK